MSIVGIQPQTLDQSICLSKKKPKLRNVISESASIYPYLALKPSYGTYENGMDLADEFYGDAQGEAKLFAAEIHAMMPNAESTTEWDTATAFDDDSPFQAVEYEQGEVYRLKGSSLTTTKDQTILICAASGLFQIVASTLNYSKPFYRCHAFVASETVSAKSYCAGEYLGLITIYASSLAAYNYEIFSYQATTTSNPITLDTGSDDFIDYIVTIGATGTVDISIQGYWSAEHAAASTVKKFAETADAGDTLDAWGTHDDVDVSIPAGGAKEVVSVPIVANASVTAGAKYRVKLELNEVVTTQDFIPTGVLVTTDEYN